MNIEVNGLDISFNIAIFSIAMHSVFVKPKHSLRKSHILKEINAMAEESRKTRYQVFTDDNFNYMDESERIAGDVFDTAEEAIAAAKKIVDDSLRHEYRHHRGISAKELWDYYTDFGEDPFIRSSPRDPECKFSAWNYAEGRAEEIIREFEDEGDPDKS